MRNLDACPRLDFLRSLANVDCVFNRCRNPDTAEDWQIAVKAGLDADHPSN